MRKYILFSIISVVTYSLSLGQNLKSFNSGSLKLYYEEYGKGPALYILSGGPGEAP
jgi:proline iminopeptidase